MIIRARADLIGRLNELLRLGSPANDLALLDNGAWSALLDLLYWALLGEIDRTQRDDVFHRAATRLGVRRAQEELRNQLPILQNAQPSKGNVDLAKLPSFKFQAQTLYLFVDDEGFAPRYLSTDFPTMVYQMLFTLINRLKLKPSDFLTCANEKCRTIFVPIRERSAFDRAFCSQGCANLIAARDYRERKAEELKEKEKDRSDTRYEEKIRKRYPKAKITRRPRKP